MIVQGSGLRAINEAATFRGSWDGRCDGCGSDVLESDKCWYWVSSLFCPIVHCRCFEDWASAIPAGLPDGVLEVVERGRRDLSIGHVSDPDLGRLAELKKEAEMKRLQNQLRGLGCFADYVSNWESAPASPSDRLDELYESITIWEIYKRLLPDKPHGRYDPNGNTSCACPHETGKSSLSMSINDAKGVYFCFHEWSGNNKMALYCEIRGLINSQDQFHYLKRLMVWEFRGVNPYADGS